ncbi:MAG: aspartyl/glutamyl-tRNA(Asn/Gln) amidotransferase subunit C [Acidimicrobiales bacterium]|nr:MAG: aspartyl/glutamyl-tRNA(Asn/Gln) amidotransferase subunit C [Acidimicrobiales bacterium]
MARLARLALREDESKRFAEQLGAILEHAARLGELPLDDVPPMAHPIPLANVTRDDVPGRCLERESVLQDAPEVRDGMFLVPPILGEAP